MAALSGSFPGLQAADFCSSQMERERNSEEPLV